MANIKQVAVRAGLSPSCVSKYLKNKSSVRDDTRQKIETAITELHYMPSSIARSLRTNKTYTIKILTPSITNPFFANMFELLLNSFKKAGYRAVLQIIDPAQPFAPTDFSWVDGVVLCFSNDDQTVDTLLKILNKLGKPLICIHWHGTEAQGTVVFDLKEGSKQVALHLLQQGCSSISFVDGPENSLVVQARYSGFCEVVSPGRRLHVEYGDFSLEWGFEAVSKMIATGNLPEGVICGNDVIAAGVIKRLQAEKIIVPRDIAVAGFDDIPLASMYSPSISSLAIPLNEMTSSATLMLVQAMEGKIVDNTYFTGILMQRESTAR